MKTLHWILGGSRAHNSTMNEEARIHKASVNVRKMLNDRGMHGQERDIQTVHNCPGFVWGTTRKQSSVAVFAIRNINKNAIKAVFDFCQPPAAEGDEEEHPHAGNDFRHAIVIYLEKCTTIASKEIENCESISVERFKLQEVLLFPLIFGYVSACRVLAEDEVDVLKREIELEKLPKLWASDPMQRYFNANVGDVYCIKQRFGSLQPQTQYRVVTEQSC